MSLNVTSASSIYVFRKHLKTHLFSHSFPKSPVVPVQCLYHFGHYNWSYSYYRSISNLRRVSKVIERLALDTLRPHLLRCCMS